MCRLAAGTPMLCAISRCESIDIPLHPKLVRIPGQPQLARRRHVSNQGRRSHDDRAGQVAFSTESHSILPVAVERGDRALAFDERGRSLSKARTAPRLTNLASDRAKHVGDRVAAKAHVGAFDLKTHATRSGEHDELLRRLRHALSTRRAD